MLIQFKYFELIKPRIILGNIILMTGSFVFASNHSSFNWILFLNTVLGMSLVIASACILNNIIDADIDRKMNRTKNRIFLINALSLKLLLILSILIGTLGIFILGFFVNYLCMLLSIFGFLIYVILYTLCYKRKTIYSTFIGSFSGSIPSTIGYTAVTDNIDICAILLFITFIFWQMSHFYAISIFRFQDYKKAQIPVFPVIKGVFLTKKHIFVFILIFIFLNFLLTFLGFLSYKFLFFSFIINFFWLFLSYCSLQERDNIKYGSQLFYYSIVVMVLFNLFISLDDLFYI